MKKVLVLTVIAILALGVMALAGQTKYSYSSSSNTNPTSAQATCSKESLTVVSTITIKAGFIATATSYNATFCGATGNLLDTEYEGGTINNNSNLALLALLTFETNTNNITVTLDTNQTVFNGLTLKYATGEGTFDPSTVSFENSAGAFSWSGSSAPYYGFYAVAGSVSAWTEAQKTGVEFEFTITPHMEQ